jgi:hypothetical protein
MLKESTKVDNINFLYFLNQLNSFIWLEPSVVVSSFPLEEAVERPQELALIVMLHKIQLSSPHQIPKSEDSKITVLGECGQV